MKSLAGRIRGGVAIEDHSARNLATIRRAVLNMLPREPSKTSLKRKRLKALISPAYPEAVLAG